MNTKPTLLFQRSLRTIVMEPKARPSFGSTLKKFSYNENSSEERVYVEKRDKSSASTVTFTTRKPAQLHDTNSSFFKVRIEAKIKSLSPDVKVEINTDGSETNITSVKRKNPNSSKSKSKRRKYAGPEVYSHLDPLRPLLRPGLLCVFVGFNPGIETALKGHSYAHPSNSFWKYIYQSGCVDRKVTYLDDEKLPDEYSYGFTDLLSRPTRGIDELSHEEMLAGVLELEERIKPHQPKIIALIGKGIWEKIVQEKSGSRLKPKEFEWGIQYRPQDVIDSMKEKNYKFKTKRGRECTSKLPFNFCGGNSVIHVLPSTSGLTTSPSPEIRLELWKSLAEEIDFAKTIGS